MSSDVVSLVALDLILGFVLRRVMHMALIAKVLSMDSNDGARDATCFGIPGDMVPYLKPLRHPSNPSLIRQVGRRRFVPIWHLPCVLSHHVRTCSGPSNGSTSAWLQMPPTPGPGHWS
ncbi:hypothetical protein D3C72_2167350 [compost metagenome]